MNINPESVCAICKKTGGKFRLWTVRESWIRAGGSGSIPDSAIVHITCDEKEIAMLEAGKIKLSDLWTKI